MPYLSKRVYESLPGVYAALGAALLWLSYRYRAEWWSTTCGVAGLAGTVAGLMIWMHRRDYRATSADYLRRGKPVSDDEEVRS
jgi:hypothetical protein